MEPRPFNDIEFEEFLREGRLMGSRCKSCGKLFVPPRPICVNCSRSDMEWAEMKGAGKLSAFTCIAVGPPAMREEGYDRKNPYCTGVIELDEGPRMVARIEGMDTSKPEEIKVGTPMIMTFLHRGEGEKARVILAFKPQ